jgi:hypothetical protein
MAPDFRDNRSSRSVGQHGGSSSDWPGISAPACPQRLSESASALSGESR